MIILIGTIFIYCGKFKNKPRAIGSGIEWNIFASENLSKIFLEILPPDTLRMPPREPLRKLIPVSPKNWEFKQKLANIVWILNAQNSEQREIMRSLLTADAFEFVLSGNVIEKEIPDLWAKPQKVIVFFSKNISSLEIYLRTNKKTIQKKIQNLEKKQLKWDLYRTHEQIDINQILWEKYKFRLRIPRDWMILEEGKKYVWFGKDFPMRWFSVSWKDGDILVPDAWKWREEIGLNNYRKIEQDTSAREEEILTFHRWRAKKIRGLWYHKEEPKGGPFSSFMFYDSATDKWYFLDMQVYAPDREKMRFIREMEVMAETFETLNP